MGLAVLEHLKGIIDLHAEDAVYHRSCYSNFMTGKNIPSKYQPTEANKRKRGRPKDNVLEDVREIVRHFKRKEEKQCSA